MRELYNWTIIQELKFGNPTGLAMLSSPTVLDDSCAHRCVSLHFKFYCLSVLFELPSAYIEPLGASEVETALLVCRMWSSVQVLRRRSRTDLPFWSLAEQALFRAGLVLANARFRKGYLPAGRAKIDRSVEYVRDQLQTISEEYLAGHSSNTAPIAAFSVPFFDHACRLQVLSQMRQLQFKGIKGIMHFLAIWPSRYTW